MLKLITQISTFLEMEDNKQLLKQLHKTLMVLI